MKFIKNFLSEFKAFALRGNVLDMAVGMIIGTAFTGIVKSLTDNFINPLLNFITGVQRYGWGAIAGFASAFFTAVINFIIMAFVLFVLLKGINALTNITRKKKNADEAPAAPTTKICPFCKSEISIEATRCPHCTSQLDAE